MGIALNDPAQREQRKKAFQRSVDEYKKVVARVLGSADYRYEYAYSLNLLADLQRDVKLIEEAELTYVDAIGRYEEVIDQQPENTALAMHTAAGQRAYANFLKVAGRKEEAIKTFEKSVPQYRELVRLVPSNHSHKNDLAFALHELASLHLELGRYVQAKECWQESVEIMESVTEWWPKNQTYQLRLGEFLWRLGQTCYELQQPQESQQHLTRSLAVLGPWIHEDTQRHWHNIQAHGHHYLFKIAVDEERNAAAEKHFQEARRKWKIAYKRAPEHPWDLADLRLVQSEFAKFLEKRERYDEAITAYQQAIEYAEEYRVRFNKNNKWAVNDHWKLTRLLKQVGKKDAATKQARLALDAIANASIDYKVRITTPGVYRLFLHGSGHDRGSDSCAVRIVELLDGPGGPVPDWYSLTFLAEQGHDHIQFGWKRRSFEFEHGTIDAGHEPAIWEINDPGDYTIRILMREDGFAFNALVLQLVSLPFSEELPVTESLRTKDDTHLEQDGRVVVEAEHFSSRMTGPGDHKWLVIPDEDPGHGFRDTTRNQKHVQVLPPHSSTGRFMGMPGKRVNQDHYRSRIALFKQLLAKNPRSKELQHDLDRLHHPLALQLWRDGKYDTALQALEKCFASQVQLYGRSSNPTNLEYSNTIEKLILKPFAADARHYEKIVEWERETVDNSPFYVFHRDMLALAYLRAGRYDEAIVEHRLALNVGGLSDSKIAEFAARFAWAYAELGETKISNRWLKIAVQWANSKGGHVKKSLSTSAAWLKRRLERMPT